MSAAALAAARTLSGGADLKSSERGFDDDDVVAQILEAQGAFKASEATCVAGQEGTELREIDHAQVAEDVLAYLTMAQGNALSNVQFITSTEMSKLRDSSLSGKVESAFSLPMQPNVTKARPYHKKGAEKQPWSMEVRSGYTAKGVKLSPLRAIACLQAWFECMRAICGVHSYVLTDQYKNRRPLARYHGGKLQTFGDPHAYQKFLRGLMPVGTGWGQRLHTVTWGHLLCGEHMPEAVKSDAALEPSDRTYQPIVGRGAGPGRTARKAQEAALDARQTDKRFQSSARRVATHIGTGEYGQNIVDIDAKEGQDALENYKLASGNAGAFPGSAADPPRLAFRAVLVRPGKKKGKRSLVDRTSAAYAASDDLYDVVPGGKAAMSAGGSADKYEPLLHAELLGVPSASRDIVPRQSSDADASLVVPRAVVPRDDCKACGQLGQALVAGSYFLRYQQLRRDAGGFSYEHAIKKYRGLIDDSSMSGVMKSLQDSARRFEGTSAFATALADAETKRKRALKDAAGRARLAVGTRDARQGASDRKVLSMTDRERNNLALLTLTGDDIKSEERLIRVLRHQRGGDAATRDQLISDCSDALKAEARRHGGDGEKSIKSILDIDRPFASKIVLGLAGNSPAFQAFKDKDAAYTIAVLVPKSGEILRLNLKRPLAAWKSIALFRDLFGAKTSEFQNFAARMIKDAAEKGDEREVDRVAGFIRDSIKCAAGGAKAGGLCVLTDEGPETYVPADGRDEDGKYDDKKQAEVAKAIARFRKDTAIDDDMEMKELAKQMRAFLGKVDKKKAASAGKRSPDK